MSSSSISQSSTCVLSQNPHFSNLLAELGITSISDNCGSVAACSFHKLHCSEIVMFSLSFTDRCLQSAVCRRCITLSAGQRLNWTDSCYKRSMSCEVWDATVHHFCRHTRWCQCSTLPLVILVPTDNRRSASDRDSKYRGLLRFQMTSLEGNRQYLDMKPRILEAANICGFHLREIRLLWSRKGLLRRENAGVRRIRNGRCRIVVGLCDAGSVKGVMRCKYFSDAGQNVS